MGISASGEGIFRRGKRAVLKRKKFQVLSFEFHVKYQKESEVGGDGLERGTGVCYGTEGNIDV